MSDLESIKYSPFLVYNSVNHKVEIHRFESLRKWPLKVRKKGESLIVKNPKNCRKKFDSAIFNDWLKFEIRKSSKFFLTGTVSTIY